MNSITSRVLSRNGTAVCVLALLCMASGLSFGQVLQASPTDANAVASGAPAAISAHLFIPNPHPFSKEGGPHVLPMRSPEYFLNPPPPPASAHLTYYGGRVVSNLQVVQVIWGTGKYLPQVTSTGTPSMASFYGGVLDSRYMDWLNEYDTSGLAPPTSNQIIGRGTFLAQYTITPSTSAKVVSDGRIKAEIAAQIAAGHLPAPLTDGSGNTNTYYAVFFPHGTTITLGRSASCVQFCAYHGTVSQTSAHREFFYGVHPDMEAGSGCDLGCGGSPTTFNNQTSVASHEMIETTTDGEVGLAKVVGPPLAWYDQKNGEIGDICNGQQGSIVGSDGVTYTVQREWSNEKKGCVVWEP